MSGGCHVTCPCRILLPTLAVLLVVLPTLQTASPVGAEPTGDPIPVWMKGDVWSYEVDKDVSILLIEGLIVDHIEENWTRHVYQVYEEDGETVYKIWETREGIYSGSVVIPPWDLDVSVDVDAHGWSHYRASDMAIMNSTQNLTFSGSLPLVGAIRGYVDNSTDYDPPMPVLEYPLAAGTWDVSSTVNTTFEMSLLSPQHWSTSGNGSDLWNLTVTVTGTSPRTVPAGTFEAFTVHEDGTRDNGTRTLDVNRTWHYATEAGAAIEADDGHQLVYTDYEYVPPNQPPTGPAGPVELSTEEDVPLDIDLRDHFTDPEGDDLTFVMQLDAASAANASLEGSGADWTVVPRANWSGHLDMTARARDTHMSEARADFVVNVTPVNDPPHVAKAPRDMTTDEDTPLWGVQDLTAVFADVDGDDLTFEVEASSGMTASLNGTALDLVPEPDWVGRAMVNITARDPTGEGAVASFRLMVGSVNDPPTIVASGGPARVHEAESGTFWVEVEDLDSTDLVYTWFIGDDEVPLAEGPTFLLSPVGLGGGKLVLSVTVTDDWDARDSLEWAVTVLDSPEIVSTSPGSPAEAEVGGAVTFVVGVEDADTAEPSITWSWKGSIVGTGTELVLTFGPGDEGTDTLTVEVTDGTGSDIAEWTVAVTVPDLPPTGTIDSPVNGSRVTVGDTITLSAEVDDEDPANLSVRWFVDGSPVGSGVQVGYSASREGTLHVQLKVSDGRSEVSDTVVVEVRPKGGDDTIIGDTDGPWPYVALALVLVGAVVAILVLRTRKRGQE